MPVRGVDVEDPHPDHEEHDGELDQHHDRVEARALLDADDQHPGDETGDHDPGQVEPAAGAHEVAHGRIVVEGRSGYLLGQMYAEDGEDILEVFRPTMGDGHRGHGVFEDEVPPDDPGEELAHGGVGVGVGGARDRHHRRELGVAEGREDARDAGGHEGKHEGGARTVVGRLAGEHEDAGADDGPDPEGRELRRSEDAAEAVLPLGLLEEHGERLAGEELVSHKSGKHRGGTAKVNPRRREGRPSAGGDPAGAYAGSVRATFPRATRS